MKKFRIICCLCMCVYIFMCVCWKYAYSHLGSQVWKPEVDVGFFLQLLFYLIFWGSVFTEPSHQLTRMAGQEASGILLSLLPHQWDDRHILLHTDFFMSARDLNSDPHAYVASTLLTEPALELYFLNELYVLLLVISRVPCPNTAFLFCLNVCCYLILIKLY